MRGTTTGERIAAALGLRPIDGHDGRVGRPGVRLAAAGFVALTGAVLAVPNAAGFAGAADPVRSALAVVGTAVSLALVAIGVLLYRSRFGDRNLVRVAGWNLLGLVVLGAVVSLHVVASGLTAAPGTGTFLVGNLLAVGAAAHVIIGFYDAQRVRAGRLASERRKLAVLARVLRHNLRNDATVIRGHAARAADRLDAPAGATDGGVDAASTGGEGPNEPSSGPSAAAVGDARESLSVVVGRADRLGGYADATGRILRSYDSPVGRGESVDLAAAAVAVVDAAADRFPDADLRVTAPERAPVRGDSRVERALEELVENACEHAGDRPRVEVTVTAGPRETTVVVADDGDGIPADERATVFDDAAITQTTHGTGVGLWTVRAAVDSCGGTVGAEGSSVRVTLPTA